MLKGLADRFKRRRDGAPKPLMPGEAADSDFEYDIEGATGKRYDMARAFARSAEIADARRTLGLEDDEIEASMGEFEAEYEEAAEQ